MSRAEILFDAITNVRPELIEEAQEYKFRRRTRIPVRRAMPWLAAAACVALLVVTVRWSGFFNMGGNSGGSANFGGMANGSAAPESSDTGGGWAAGDTAGSSGVTDVDEPSGEEQESQDAASDDSAATMPGAAGSSPTVMVNGMCYQWGDMLPDGLPEGSVYYGDVEYVDGERPVNDREIVGPSDVTGEIYVVPGDDSTVYLVLSGESLDSDVVAFDLIG